MRHIISRLAKRLSEDERQTPEVRALAAYGCSTYMHFVQLVAPRLDGEDAMKGIDFSAEGIAARWQSGLSDMRDVLSKRPWEGNFDPIEGLYLHDPRA
jgi:NTE family protein